MYLKKGNFDDALDHFARSILFELVDGACDIRRTDNSKRKRALCLLFELIFGDSFAHLFHSTDIIRYDSN